MTQSSSQQDHQHGTAAAMIERLSRLIRASEHSSDLRPAQWDALRYLARCNRFSNSPTALSEYLAATKGTVSQTVKALAAKGLVQKTQRPGHRRSVALDLTAKAWAVLESDPWWRLATHERELAASVHGQLCDGLKLLLERELELRAIPAFGTCRSCQHFEDPVELPPRDMPHCRHFNQSLAADDTTRLCAGYVASLREAEQETSGPPV